MPTVIANACAKATALNQPFVKNSLQKQRRTVKYYGWKPQHPDHRDHKLFLSPAHLASLPSSVDLRPKCPPVYDQGELGSCTANALGAAWQYALQAENKPAPNPSRLFIYYFERDLEGTVNQDAGAEIRDGAKVLATYGCCDESLWKYNINAFAFMPNAVARATALKHEATKYLAVAQSPSQIKGALAQGFPVVFGITVYESFEGQDVANTGIVPMPSSSEQVVGGHAICIVGYDDAKQMYIVRNSWGTDWGVKGYCYMPYAYIHNPDLASDFWTIRVVN